MEGKEFYYQVMNDSDGKAVFLITPKAFYDTEGCLFDSMGAVNEILPRGFQEYKPSYFSFPGDPAIAKQMLMVLGMTEINFGLTSVKPHKSTEHLNEEDDDDEGYDDDDDEGDYDDDDEPDDDDEVDAGLHGPRVEEQPFYNPIDAEEHEKHEEMDEEDIDPNPRVNPPINPIQINADINRLGLPLHFGRPQNPTPNNLPPNKQTPPPAPLPQNDSGDLDELLKEAAGTKEHKGFDYKNMSTAALLRHKTVMINTESYMEASKIQKELDARNITHDK
jgi:hypothetical protein